MSAAAAAAMATIGRPLPYLIDDACCCSCCDCVWL